MKAAIELVVKLAHAKAAHVGNGKGHGAKDEMASDAALDSLGFEETDAE